VAFSLALHVLALVGIGRFAGLPGGHDGLPDTAPLHVRLPAAATAPTQLAAQPIRDLARKVSPQPADKTPRSAPPAVENHAPAVALPTPDIFYPPDELDASPHPAEDLALSYPSDGIAHRTGYVQLTLFIDESGKLERVVRGDTDLPQMFADSVEVELRNVRYLPGQIGDRPVKSQLVLRIDFD
jgi:hypothetical protein